MFQDLQIRFINCFEILPKMENVLNGDYLPASVTALQVPLEFDSHFSGLGSLSVVFQLLFPQFYHVYPTSRSHCIPSAFVRFRNLAQLHFKTFSNIFLTRLHSPLYSFVSFHHADSVKFRRKVTPNCSTVSSPSSFKSISCVFGGPL
jgi:hypothetical protein